MKQGHFHILISRTDAIGDVVLTLPVCGYLKSRFPEVTISFLGRTYTAPVINACTAVDYFINYDELSALSKTEQIEALQIKNFDAVIHIFPNKHVAHLTKAAGIKWRIGTTNRFFHWFTCNKLVKLSRKNSDLHEAQLNMALLKPFGIPILPLKDVHKFYAFEPDANIPFSIAHVLKKDKFNLIIHPKSHGSGAEWPLDKYSELFKLLSPAINIIITGSEKERALLQYWITEQPIGINDLTGKLNLTELLTLIKLSDGLVAAGTGPLHVAAATGINTLGLFPRTRPIHPGRWAPIGARAQYLESNNGTLNNIHPASAAAIINNWIK
ncbi:glycosyltransferase family 9 protein [Mucilaginibacter hurinus]|uniref:glycosyltransferase family 9 protein n=1 Tax=Mucilaginibacter hurinus TaxID=2201324 RepID=UPI001F3727B9|nr:glycosyltransferase family 9 protein [Mucilaginibacter hurinus]